MASGFLMGRQQPTTRLCIRGIRRQRIWQEERRRNTQPNLQTKNMMLNPRRSLEPEK